MSTQNTLKVAVIGASGYTGAELIRLLIHHPKAEIALLVAESNAGQKVGAIYPHLAAYNLPDLIHLSQVNWQGLDAVFCCLPHATAQEVVKLIPSSIKVIDVSADFRLYDTETYAKWYGEEHKAPELQKDAVYGLTEMARESVKKARLVACPGCYPTSTLLPLVPLLKAKVIEKEDIIIDSKSGITGAGRSAKQANLFAEVNEGVWAYNICKHRHIPEIEQTLSLAAGESVEVHFTPQVVPMNRGILSNIYVKLAKGKTVKDLRAVLEKQYQGEPFVRVLPEGEFPSTRQVRGSNQCNIGIAAGRTADRAVIVSVIDNLVKGASGQAVQNFNLMFGLEETTALDVVPLFP